MSTTASVLINWNAIWKIILTALVCGTGVVIVFGLLLLGISRGKTATKPTTRCGLYTLSALCGLLVVAVAAGGVYAMTQKPSSAKPKPKPAAAMFAPAGVAQQVSTTPRRVASCWRCSRPPGASRCSCCGCGPARLWR